MGENKVEEKNVLDYIKDLARPELTHDYDNEIAYIESMLKCEKAKETELNRWHIRKLEKEIESLKISNMAMAYYIQSKEI